MLLIFGISALAISAYFVAEAVSAPARQRTLAIRRAATYGNFKRATRSARDPFRKRALDPMKGSLAGWVLRLNPRTSVEAVSAKLHAAGLSRRKIGRADVRSPIAPHPSVPSSD